MDARRYERAVAIVKQIVDEADPEGLLELGAPADEYDDHAADAARRLLRGDDPSDIASSWSSWFGARSSTWFAERLQHAQAMLRDQGE